MPSQKRRAAQKKPSGMRAFYWVLAIVAVLGLAAIGYAVARGGTGGAATKPVTLQGVDNPQALFQRAHPEVAGSSDAPVRVVVFSDYTCPYCGRFASEVQPQLMANEVKAGKVQIVYYDFPLGGTGEHKYSFLSARAARCAGDQGKFWEYHDLLFGHQMEWAYGGGSPVSEFEQYGQQLGLDAAKFDACLKSDAHADVVTADHMLGEQLGIDSTPTVIINERRVRNPLDYSALQDLVKQSTPGQG